MPMTYQRPLSAGQLFPSLIASTMSIEKAWHWLKDEFLATRLVLDVLSHLPHRCSEGPIQ